MVWIKTVPVGQSDGELREIYDRIEAQRGHPVEGLPMLHSLNPQAMWSAAELMWACLRGPSGLTDMQRQMIAAVTALALRSRYLTIAMSENLRRQGLDDLSVEQIRSDWRQMELSDVDRAILDYSDKLTRTPSAMTESDVQKLRAVGLNDRDILDVVQACAYLNFRARVADALGLELEPRHFEASRTGRAHAATMAKERGAPLPPDLFGMTET